MANGSTLTDTSINKSMKSKKKFKAKRNSSIGKMPHKKNLQPR